jgi:hypothetical protein
MEPRAYLERGGSADGRLYLSSIGSTVNDCGAPIGVTVFPATRATVAR